MIDTVAFTLYVKRVLREVRRHSSDTYIDRQIIGEIERRVLELSEGRTDEASVRAALKQMEPASELGYRYRAEYRSSAEKPDGFLLFETFFSNVAAMALLLLTVFVVFRLFPQKEYVGYAACAVAAACAAILAHKRFYNIHYSLATILIPAFLLLYYPCKHSIQAARAPGGSFLTSFFSYRYHIIFISLIVITIVYSAVTALLHAKTYLRSWVRTISILAAVLFLVACSAGFATYANHLKQVYHAEAEVCLAAARESFDGYLQNEQDALKAAEEDAGKIAELYERYAGIYVPADRQTGGAYEALLEMFEIWETGTESLIVHFHAGYDAEKRKNPIQTEPIDEKIRQVQDSVERLLNRTSDGEPFQQLLELESRCQHLQSELQTTVLEAYHQWIYQ